MFWCIVGYNRCRGDTMTYKIQFGIRLDEETLTAIKEIAVDENRSLNNLIEYLIKQYIKEKKSENEESPKG